MKRKFSLLQGGSLLCPVFIQPFSRLFLPFTCLLLIQMLGFKSISAQNWTVVGSENDLATAASSFTSIAVVMEGATAVPHVAFTEANIAKVKKRSGNSWVQVGDNISSGNATYTRLYATGSGQLFVSYVDASNGNRLAVKTFNAAANAWKPLGESDANLYVSAGSVTFSISQYSSTARSCMAFDTAMVPYIIFGEGSGLHPTVERFNGSTWETVGGAAINSSRAIGVGLAIDSTTNIPYAIYINQAASNSTTGALMAYRFTAAVWENLPVPNPVLPGSASTGATTALRHSSIAFNSNWNPVVTYFNAGNSNRSTVIVYDKATATWSYQGTTSTRDAFTNNLIRDSRGNLYNSFTDMITNNSGRSLARVMKQEAGSNTWTELKNPDETGIEDYVGNLTVSIAPDSATPYLVYTKGNTLGVVAPVVRRYSLQAVDTTPVVPDSVVTTPKQMEKLNRGLVAVRTGAGSVYVGWRMFGTDATDISFNLYRDGVKLNATPIATTTNFVDNTSTNGVYTVKPVINGIEGEASEPATAWQNIYKTIPLQIPPGGTTPDGVAYTYTANDASVGDVDGDGEYEIFLKWDPTNSKDNSQSGYTGNVYIDCYKMDGTKLWRIDLGRNIRAGAHYTQFMVYDLDGDGRAEMTCKTADATIDGVGTIIGNHSADYRNGTGYVLSGPEFLTVFNGLTGAAMATTDYLPARGDVNSWGDNYGNRVDRFIDAIAYVDGARPSLITGRGYYTRLVRAAWDYRNGQLTNRWIFDSNSPGNGTYAGQGNHQMAVGDVDGDGKDEICNGNSMINDNGKGHHSTQLGHGDALHMTDLDPDRPGQEIWQCNEEPSHYGNYALELRDAKTGELLWGPLTGDNGDVGRAMAADLDSTRRGYEVWGIIGGLYDCKGNKITDSRPSVNFGIWWDGDLGRELLDGTKLDKWNPATNSSNRLLSLYNYENANSNNTTKANPCLTADLYGDWREEILVRSDDNKKLLLFTTTAPTQHRLYTLMHNPQYRTAVAWQNSAYNQPPYVDYYLGYGMTTPPQPNIYLANANTLPVTLVSFTAEKQKPKQVLLQWHTTAEANSRLFVVERSSNSVQFSGIGQVAAAGNSSTINSYQLPDEYPLTGSNYYRLKMVDQDGKFTYSPVKLVEFTAGGNVFSIVPNPVTNSARLIYNAEANGHLQLGVSTADGKLLLTATGNLGQLNTRLNNGLSSLKPGVYFVRLANGNEVHIQKFIKQ